MGAGYFHFIVASTRRISGELSLPALTAEGEIEAARSVDADLMLPALAASSDADAGRAITADLALPGLTASSDATAGRVIDADLSMPALTSGSELAAGRSIEADLSLPAATISAHLVTPCYLVYASAVRGQRGELVATVSRTLDSLIITGEPNSRLWYSVRAMSRCGVFDIEPLRQKLVAFDADGNFVAPIPNRPIDLRVTRGAGGGLTATWAYITAGQAIAPAMFNVYRAIGDAAFDFTTPFATLAYSQRRDFSVSLGTHAHGASVRCVVRAESADGDEDRNHAQAIGVADALAPSPATSIDVEVLA